MILTSPSFDGGRPIPRKFTCDGGNINPELHIGNVPDEAKSLAMIVHDPDAPDPNRPSPEGFSHWVVWNIDPSTSIIKEESVPPGAEEGLNGGGEFGYTGPCPPSGAHRYIFYLYALDTALELMPETGKKELEAAMDGHIIAGCELTGVYSRGGNQE